MSMDDALWEWQVLGRIVLDCNDRLTFTHVYKAGVGDEFMALLKWGTELAIQYNRPLTSVQVLDVWF